MIFHLEDIIVYPIKSMGGVHLKSAGCGADGLAGDRAFMLVDPSGRFLSQRDLPKMALFKISIVEDSGLVVDYAGDQCILTPEDVLDDLLEVTVWEHRVNARLVKSHIHSFFSKHLGVSCRLVRLLSQSDSSDQKWYSSCFKDSSPLLIIGTASLDYLNQRLDQSVGMSRFRPNLVLRTSEPHEEDHLKKFRIGAASFEMVKPCSRCVMINVDQQTAAQSKEPLRTLAGYRSNNHRVNFGMYASALTAQAELVVGDVFSA